MTEDEYWNHFNQLAHDINQALEVFNTAEEINHLALEDKGIRRCLESEALFWNIQMESLQSTLFMILGRLFDSSKGTLTVSRFLDETMDHPGFFSRDALARRKVPYGPRPEWLKDRIAEAWIPGRPDLAKLKEALKPHEKRAKVYREIRHAYYAHRVLGVADRTWDLFRQTNREALGDTLCFLSQLKAEIRQLYYNGKEPNLNGDLNDHEAAAIRQSVRRVLTKLTQTPVAG